MSKITLVDTSFLYALYNAKDARHGKAVSFSLGKGHRICVPDVVLPEISFLFDRDIGADGTTKFLRTFAVSDAQLMAVSQVDLIRMAAIMTEYATAQFDLVDCCIMALSERLNVRRVLTFDRRDFQIFRPRHCAYLELLP
jgi:predicted nucleic acid-binding protein